MAPTPARTGAALALAAMVSVQLGLALSVPLFAVVGAAGASWLRLSWAALLLGVLARPRPRSMSRSALLTCAVLGLVTAAMTLTFTEAIARLPLGTASALQFLGPLGVAVVRGHRRAVLWPALAAAGVALLTEPWRGGADVGGVGWALASAVCWAAYILLTQRVGDEVSGLRALGISLPVAAVAATVVAAPSALPALTPGVVLAGLGLAVLVPVVPFTLELLALRRLTAAAFGTLASVEPAIALLLGLLVLAQVPRASAVAGIVLVVAAGVGAARGGSRPVVPAAPGGVPAVDGRPS